MGVRTAWPSSDKVACSGPARHANHEDLPADSFPDAIPHVGNVENAVLKQPPTKWGLSDRLLSS